MKGLLELLNNEEYGGDYVINTPFIFKQQDDDCIDELVNEITYSDFKNDNSISVKEKINNNINEVNKQLYKLEQLVGHIIKLKAESNIENKVFYRNTSNKFNKIQEKLNRLSHNIRELSK